MRDTRLEPGWLALTLAAYAAVGELTFWMHAPFEDPVLGCVTRSPGYYRYVDVPLIAILIVHAVSTAWLARSTKLHWLPVTAAHASVALAAGIPLADGVRRLRMAAGAECRPVEFCTWCMGRAWHEYALWILLSALAGLAGGAVIGWLARLPGARRAA